MLQLLLMRFFTNHSPAWYSAPSHWFTQPTKKTHYTVTLPWCLLVKIQWRLSTKLLNGKNIHFIHWQRCFTVLMLTNTNGTTSKKKGTKVATQAALQQIHSNRWTSPATTHCLGATFRRQTSSWVACWGTPWGSLGEPWSNLHHYNRDTSHQAEIQAYTT